MFQNHGNRLVLQAMKRKALIGVIFIGFCFTPVIAQNPMRKLSCGFKAEGNISNFFISGIPDVKSSIGFGTAFGGFVKFDISEHFAIQEDVFILYKASTLKKGDIKGEYEYGGIEIPIYAMWQWNKNEGQRLYLGVGPYAEWGLNTIIKIGKSEIDLYKKNETTNKAYMEKLAFGFATTIGYEFRDGTQVNAGYKIILTNVLEKDKDKASMYSNMLSVGVAYRFK